MGTQNIREAMQAELSKEEIPEVTHKTETTEVKTEGEPNSDTPASSSAGSDEPDEESYEDRAEYKKALKEWTKKQAESELREEHKRVTSGYHADLMKSRAKARELNQRLQEIQANQAPMQKPIKPDVSKYSDPEQYANDVVKYDRLEREQEARTKAESEERQQMESSEIDDIWAHNSSKCGIDDIDQIVEHVQKTNLLAPLSTKVREDLVLSAAGQHMLKFLAMNPHIVDEIADSQNPRVEMKKLETMMIASIAKSQSVALAPKVTEPIKEAHPVQKHAPVTAPKTVVSQTNSGTKQLAGASSMESFMQARKALKRR